MKSACGWARKRSRQAAARSGGSSTGAGSALKKIVHASEQERADVAEARQRWKEDQPALDPARLVFIDETGTSANTPAGVGAITGTSGLPAGDPSASGRRSRNGWGGPGPAASRRG